MGDEKYVIGEGGGDQRATEHEAEPRCEEPAHRGLREDLKSRVHGFTHAHRPSTANPENAETGRGLGGRLVFRELLRQPAS